MASLTLIALFTAAWFAEDVGLWPWVEGSAPDDTPYDRALAPVRAGRRAYGIYGRGVVLVDLRPEVEAAVSYISGTLLAASDSLLPPYIAVQVMIEGYDLERAVLVVVHTTPLFMVYRLDRTPGAPPPDTPLIDVDQ